VSRTSIEKLFLKLSNDVSRSLPFLSMINFSKKKIKVEIKSILDLGCGKGTALSLELAKYKKAYLVGVDIFLPSLIKAKNCYGDVILANVKFLPINSKSCDLVVASQVMEHLDKRTNFLKTIENIANKLIIITVPVGHNPKHALEDSNPDQAHNSEWYPWDFKKLGFQVYGCEGARFLRSEKSQFKGPKGFYRFLLLTSFFTQFITYKLAVASYQMVCIKSR
jgi:SAM-dependent methyltransferase